MRFLFYEQLTNTCSGRWLLDDFCHLGPKHGLWVGMDALLYERANDRPSPVAQQMIANGLWRERGGAVWIGPPTRALIAAVHEYVREREALLQEIEGYLTFAQGAIPELRTDLELQSLISKAHAQRDHYAYFHVVWDAAGEHCHGPIAQH